jgi:cysteinyl-tRNA synthetase
MSIRSFPHRLHASQTAFRAALCDSFNTPLALEVLLKLVSRSNVYITERGKNVNAGVVERTARWIGKMLRMFGLGEGESEYEIGWGEERREGLTNVSTFLRVCRPQSFSLNHIILAG